MKITFKAYGPSVDAIILGLAKSGIPVSAQVSELRALGVGDSLITADFPTLSHDTVLDMLSGGTIKSDSYPKDSPTVTASATDALKGFVKNATPTVSESERTFF